MQIKNNFIFVNTTEAEPHAACSTFQKSNPRSQNRTTVGRKGFVEYKVPSMGYTDALLKLQYLCLGHRPLKLSVDGIVVSSSFATASSGGFTENRHLKWTPVQRISGLKSEFVVRLETRGSFPNLSCLKFELFNSAEKVDELLEQVKQASLLEGLDTDKAFAWAEKLVQYNEYLDSVPEDRIRELVSESEESLSDSGDSDETVRERRACEKTERTEARKAMREEMRNKKAAAFSFPEGHSQEEETTIKDDRARGRVAARKAARQEMRAKKAALIRAKHQADKRSARLQQMKERKQAAVAVFAEKEAAARKAAEEFDLDVAAVVNWAASLGEVKLSSFIATHPSSSNSMEESDVALVMHTLICVYLKKVKKQKRAPPTHITKPYTSSMVSLVHDYSITGVFNALMKIEDEEDSVDSESGGAETESDSALDLLLDDLVRQGTDKEAEILASQARWENEQKEKEAEEQKKKDVKKLANALLQELRDLLWDLREAQYFYEMTPDCEGKLIHDSFSHIESKIQELDNIDMSVVPQVHSKVIQAKLQAREEVGYMKTRFDHRSAGYVRKAEEGYATVTRVSTWTDKYVNAMAFEYSDGSKRFWGSDFSGEKRTTEFQNQKIKTVHLWTTSKNRVAKCIKLFATDGICHEAIGSKAGGVFGLGSPDQKLRTDEEVLELVFSQNLTCRGFNGSRTHQVPQGSWLDEAEAYRFDGHVLVAHISGFAPSRVVPLPRETFKFKDGRMVVEKRLM